MQDFENFDWSGGSAETHLEMVRRGTPDQLRDLARRYDWSWHPERVLGWIMAQKCIDLGTALEVFLNGEPERFNYLPKRDVSADFRGAVQLLDNICLRLNSGFYLVYPDRPIHSTKRITKWVTYQKVDRSESRSGRWVLDEAVIAPLFNDTLHVEGGAALDQIGQHSLLMDILSPVIDLATKKVIEELPPLDMAADDRPVRRRG